jgi:cell division septum initiation protein DivIVA
MSSESAEPAEMSRGELEAEVAELRDRLDQLEATVETLQPDVVRHQHLNVVLTALTGNEHDDVDQNIVTRQEDARDLQHRVSDLESTAKQHASTVDAINSGDVDGPDEAWVAVRNEAKRAQGHPDHDLGENRVRLYADDIAKATGRSERMAQNYIEDFGEDKRGTSWRPYKPPSNANGGEVQRKSLVVDLDVWGDDGD